MSKKKTKATKKPATLSGSQLRANAMRFGLAPYLVISKKAEDKINFWVQNVPTEVGWIGLTTTPDSSDRIILVDVALCEQTVSAASVELTSAGIVTASEKLFAENSEGDDIGYWGHSHVDMPVSPSDVDVKQSMSYFDVKAPMMMTATIHNKKGDVHADVYDFHKQVFWEDIDIVYESVFSREVEDEMRAEIKAMLSKKTFPVNKHYYYKQPTNIGYAPVYNAGPTNINNMSSSGTIKPEVDEDGSMFVTCPFDNMTEYFKGTDDEYDLIVYYTEDEACNNLQNYYYSGTEFNQNF